jgi:hypothetical protein
MDTLLPLKALRSRMTMLHMTVDLTCPRLPTLLSTNPHRRHPGITSPSLELKIAMPLSLPPQKFRMNLRMLTSTWKIAQLQQLQIEAVKTARPPPSLAVPQSESWTSRMNTFRQTQSCTVCEEVYVISKGGMLDYIADSSLQARPVQHRTIVLTPIYIT